MFWSYLLQGAGLGLSAAATPGPLQAFLISRAIAHGWKRTLPAVLAPLLSDLPIVSVILLLLSSLPTEFIRFVRIAGGLYVLYLAWRTALACWHFSAQAAPPEAARRTLWQAVGINFLSPGPYLFWSLMAGPAVLRGWAIAPALGIAFIVGFYSVMTGSSALLVILFGAVRALGPRAVRAMLGLSALAMLIFGLLQLWEGIFAV
jgi:threonine/homoserine/homoserine lactone efflux protein